MNTLGVQLREVVSAVSIEPPTAFVWFGQPGPTPSDEVCDAMSAEQARAFMHWSLQAHLYSHFYCSGGVIVRREAAASTHQSAEFVNDLSAANTGRGPWQGGWELRQLLDDGIIARRDGLTVRAKNTEWRAAQTPTMVGNAVSLRLPKEAHARLPGFYLAFSDADFDSDEGLVRLYWNIRADGAGRLLRYATTLLNNAGTRFGLKLINEPASYDRCDAAVLYLHSEDWESATLVLGRVHVAMASRLLSATPPFTKRLAPGLAFAEDPPSAQSFGMTRCGMLAEGLIRAAERGVVGTDDRRQVVNECFAENGVDLDLPYLNPGSTDRYVFRPTVRNRSADMRLDNPTPAGQDGEGTPGGARFRATAEMIATQICRQALWYEGRCTWVGADPAAPLGENARQPLSSATLGPTIYSGTAGMALFLAQIASTTGVPGAEKTALAAARHALHHADRLAPSELLGLYTGGIGVAVAAARVGILLNTPELIRRASQLAHRCLEHRPGVRERDVLSGDAGAIMGLLALAEMLGEDALAEDAATVAGELVAAGKGDEEALWWPSAAGPALTGFSHGAAGIVWALLEVHARTRDERWRDVALAASRFERRWFDQEAGNWRDLRELPGSAPFMTAWCHGAPGTALSRLCAAAELEDAEWRQEALVGLATTRKAVELALDRGIDDFSLCHGLTGNADVLLEAGCRLGDIESQRIAIDVGRCGLESFAEAGRPWPCGTRTGETPTLMLGLAGIGFFYLRLADPAVSSLLLPGPRALAVSASPRAVLARAVAEREAVQVPHDGAPLVRHAGTLREDELRAVIRIGLLAGGLSVASEDMTAAQLARWDAGLGLRDRFLPECLPPFADVLDYLALADVDPRLWHSLPFMLAFGHEQAQVLQPLIGVGDDLIGEATTIGALFSTLLSSFDHVVDETAHADMVFGVEAVGVNGLFRDDGTDGELAEAYAHSTDVRVRLVCTLFSILGHAVRRLAARATDPRGFQRLEEITRQLFAAERSSTLCRARTLADLRSLARASQMKSVLPFVTLARMLALPTPTSEPPAAAVVASEALGRAICLADDLVDLLTDLGRGVPSPLVLALTERTIERGTQAIEDAAILDIADCATADLCTALRPEAFAEKTGEPPSMIVAFARRSVARWVGWGEDVNALPPVAASAAAQVMPLVRAAFAGETLNARSQIVLRRTLNLMDEGELLTALHSRGYGWVH